MIYLSFINDFLNSTSVFDFHLFADDCILLQIWNILRKLSIGNSVKLMHSFVQAKYLSLLIKLIS